jgi:hypothetical protein
MCINLETSIIAFCIGMISGIKLTNNSNKEIQLIGKFIMFYTMVQLFEAMIYYNNTKLPSMLLLLNLGFQGLFLILLLNDMIPLNKIYIMITMAVALFICYKTFHPEFKKATTTDCMKWNFNDTETGNALTIMYVIMFLAVIENHKMLDKINKFGILLFITFAISYSMNGIYCQANKPSIWCLSSAIAAPIMLIFAGK